MFHIRFIYIYFLSLVFSGIYFIQHSNTHFSFHLTFENVFQYLKPYSSFIKLSKTYFIYTFSFNIKNRISVFIQHSQTYFSFHIKKKIISFHSTLKNVFQSSYFLLVFKKVLSQFFQHPQAPPIPLFWFRTRNRPASI